MLVIQRPRECAGGEEFRRLTRSIQRERRICRNSFRWFEAPICRRALLPARNSMRRPDYLMRALKYFIGGSGDFLATASDAQKALECDLAGRLTEQRISVLQRSKPLLRSGLRRY